MHACNTMFKNIKSVAEYIGYVSENVNLHDCATFCESGPTACMLWIQEHNRR